MLDLVEEIKFAELKEKCRELKVMAPPEIMISLKVTEKDKTIFDDIQRGHSWTRNFYSYMLSTITRAEVSGSTYAVGSNAGKEITGLIGTAAGRCWSVNTNVIAGAGIVNNVTNANYGVVVGTTDTAFSANDFKLGARVEHGTSSTQLSYQAQANPASSYNSGTKVWTTTVQRVFNNNSGGSITIKEVGLYWVGFAHAISSGTYCLERSVLSPTITIPDGAQLTVSYAISMDFSAID